MTLIAQSLIPPFRSVPSSNTRSWALLLYTLATAVLIFSAAANAAPPGRPPLFGPEVTITGGSGEQVTAESVDGATELIALRPNEAVDVSINYGSAKAGSRIKATPLDGGRILGPSNQLDVGRDGVLTFRFQAGAQVGVYQIALNDGSSEVGVRFWAIDVLNPRHNPAVLQPSR